MLLFAAFVFCCLCLLGVTNSAVCLKGVVLEWGLEFFTDAELQALLELAHTTLPDRLVEALQHHMQ